MIENKNLKEELSEELHLALQLLDSISKFKIKLAKYGKSGQKVLVGHCNALPNGRADFNSSLIKSTIIKCQKVPTWPKKVQFKTVNKGHLLFVESPQSEE
jgi:hypothetical protein